MSDLTPTAFWECETNFEWVEYVTGSQGRVYVVRFDKRSHKFQEEYEYDYSCNCPSYLYHEGYCKHIKQVKTERCGWSEFVTGGDVERDNENNPICPECKGPVRAVNIGV